MLPGMVELSAERGVNRPTGQVSVKQRAEGYGSESSGSKDHPRPPPRVSKLATVARPMAGPVVRAWAVGVRAWAVGDYENELKPMRK